MAHQPTEWIARPAAWPEHTVEALDWSSAAVPSGDMDFELRPATGADTELLWTIQGETLRDIINAEFGTTIEEQREFFDANFRVTKHQVVLVEGAAAGHLYHETRGDHVYIANIAVRPPFQGRGLGTSIVMMIMEEARQAGLPVRLQVMPSNPRALRWYGRLGFERTGRDEHHVLMQWRG
jgi:ribosomal protein S18 acetylase RimI-like enzyme